MSASRSPEATSALAPVILTSTLAPVILTSTLAPVPRLALSIPEAALAIGVCENTLRQLLPELPHFYVGRRVLLQIFADPIRTSILRLPVGAHDHLRKQAK